MEMALETSEASNTARKLQLSANCWTASSAGRGVDGGGGELVKQARYIAKKFTTSVGQLIEPLSRGLNSMMFFFCKYFIGCMAGNLAEICVPGTGTGQGIYTQLLLLSGLVERRGREEGEGREEGTLSSDKKADSPGQATLDALAR